MSDTTPAPDFGNVFAATALVVPPLAVLAPLAIAWGALLPVIWIAVICARTGVRPWRGRTRTIPFVLAALIGYGALTSFWSITPDRTVDVTVKLVPILFGGWILVGAAAHLDEDARRRTSSALLIGGGLALAIIAIEIATDGLIHNLLRGNGFEAAGNLAHLNRTASQIAVLLWLLWLALGRRFGFAAAALGVVAGAGVLIALDPDTPVVAVLAGVVFFFLAYLAPQVARWLLIAGVLMVALAIPLYPILLPGIDNTLLAWGIDDFTLRHRFAIWEFTAGRAMEQLWLGWGLGSSRMIPGAGNIASQLSPAAQTLPLHPHNALLQVWLELGVPGIVFALVTVVTVLTKIRSFFAGRKELAVALTVIFSATLIAELSYGIWQSWWLVFLWVVAALTIAIAGGPRQPETS